MARSKETGRKKKDPLTALRRKEKRKKRRKAKAAAAAAASTATSSLAATSAVAPDHISNSSHNKESEMSSLLDKVEDVHIDDGRFKYILIKVHHSPEGGPEISKSIVRGYCSAGFHSDVYDQVVPAIEKLGLDCECVGGGRILHEPDKKSIEVFGYSQGYGRADHSVSVEILKKKYPDYEKITFSNDGY